MTTFPATGRPSRRRGTRALLGLLALVLLAAPFYSVWRYDTFREAVTAQEAPPGPPGTRVAARPGSSAAARTAAHDAPVVLAYHDIGRGSRSPYTVTPEAFEQQIAALAAAGYRSLSSKEFLTFLERGRTPAPRSVFITFDDGTHGLWVHADRILAKHRMKAAAFLITRQVGSHRPYYLSWEEIERMAATGRWDFENHTRDLHHRAPVDRQGRLAPALSNRLWLTGKGRPETETEYRRRIEADLDRSLRDFRARGLPRPRIFAFPFSERPTATAGSRSPSATGKAVAHGPEAGRLLTSILRSRFAVRMTNSSSRPLPAGRRAAAEGQVQRLEVTRRTDVEELRAGLASFTPADPASHPKPLERPALWRRTDNTGHTGLGALTGRGPYPGPVGYASAAYLPVGSADWSGYTVRATADRLSEARNNIGLVVRDQSKEPVTVALSNSFVRVLAGIGDGRREIARRTLDSGPEHSVEVSVEQDRTVVVVDGSVRIEHRNPTVSGGDATGGIAFSTRNGDDASAYPRLTSMTLTTVPARDEGSPARKNAE